MKRILPFICVLLVIVACKTGPQTVAFNTVYSLDSATTAIFDKYLQGVVAGKISTNDLPRVARSYNLFHSTAMLALDGIEYNTNVLASPSLVQESKDVINLINIVEQRK